MKTLASLFTGDEHTYLQGSGHRSVTGLSFDSRTTCAGDLFFAVPGLKADGHQHIPQACSRGAGAVIVSRKPAALPPDIACIQVPSVRKSLSRISARFYDHPSKEIHLIGITGTNGKTTTAAYIYHLLNSLWIKTGIISGYYCGYPGNLTTAPRSLSTPEAPHLHCLLRDFVTAGCSWAVVELTSHALSPECSRADDLRLSRMVYTSIGRDHLDFHRTLLAYYHTKLRMADLGKGRPIYCTGDNPLAGYLLDRGDRIVQLHLENPYAPGIQAVSAPDGRMKITAPEGTLMLTNLPMEKFLQENLLLAVVCILDLLPDDRLSLDVSFLAADFVPGRAQRISMGNGRECIIDYAHNPQGFAAVLQAYPKGNGRHIIVFGAAGDRDTGKRSAMADTADRLGDVIILTEEDPFSEPPLQILRDLQAGIRRKTPGKTLFVCPSRRTALSLAVAMMEPRDRLFLLGKGHEEEIRRKNGSAAWNDCRELHRIAGIYKSV